MRILKKKPIQIYIEPKQDKVLEVLARKKGDIEGGDYPCRH